MANAACPPLGRSIIHHFDESLLMDPSHKLLETHLVLLVLVLPVPRWARCSVTAEPTPANGRRGWRAFLRDFVGCPWRIASRITPHPSLYLLYTAITYRLYPLSPPPPSHYPHRCRCRATGWLGERTDGPKSERSFSARSLLTTSRQCLPRCSSLCSFLATEAYPD